MKWATNPREAHHATLLHRALDAPLHIFGRFQLPVALLQTVPYTLVCPCGHFIFFMDSTISEPIRQKLLDKEATLKKELLDVADKGVGGKYEANFPDYGNDEDENSAEVATFTDNLSVEHELTSTLRDIRSALQRLDDGTYGVCKYCGKQIDEKRLLARPWSSSCISCKEEIKSRM